MAKSQEIILKEIKSILADVKDGFDKTLLIEDDITKFDLDSLDIINFLFSLEEKFGIKIDMNIVEEMDLFKLINLVEYIINNKNGF